MSEKGKTKLVKMKSVTVKELRQINDNSYKAYLNRTWNIDGLIQDGILKEKKDLAYPVKLCMHHTNGRGINNPRVYVCTENGHSSITMDMTYEDYDNLFEMCFKLAV